MLASIHYYQINSLHAACSELTNPDNGTVTFNSERTDAEYFCNVGFSLLGSRTRTCIDGFWTGSEPECFLGVQT